MLETENSKMTRQDYKQWYLYIFKITDKTGSSNRSSSREHSHSHRLVQPNESEVSITVILAQKKTKFSTTRNSKKVSTNKCDIEGQPEIATWPSKPEVLISPTVWQISLQFRRQTAVFDHGELAESVNKWLCRTTTGNSDMAAKTGNNYITWTATDNVEIPTASPAFSTMASPNSVAKWLRQWPTTGNGNVAATTGNTYISGTMTDRMTF